MLRVLKKLPVFLFICVKGVYATEDVDWDKAKDALFFHYNTTQKQHKVMPYSRFESTLNSFINDKSYHSNVGEYHFEPFFGRDKEHEFQTKAQGNGPIPLKPVEKDHYSTLINLCDRRPQNLDEFKVYIYKHICRNPKISPYFQYVYQKGVTFLKSCIRPEGNSHKSGVFVVYNLLNDLYKSTPGNKQKYIYNTANIMRLYSPCAKPETNASTDMQPVKIVINHCSRMWAQDATPESSSQTHWQDELVRLLDNKGGSFLRTFKNIAGSDPIPERILLDCLVPNLGNGIGTTDINQVFTEYAIDCLMRVYGKDKEGLDKVFEIYMNTFEKASCRQIKTGLNTDGFEEDREPFMKMFYNEMAAYYVNTGKFGTPEERNTRVKIQLEFLQGAIKEKKDNDQNIANNIQNNSTISKGNKHLDQFLEDLKIMKFRTEKTLSRKETKGLPVDYTDDFEEVEKILKLDKNVLKELPMNQYERESLFLEVMKYRLNLNIHQI